MRQALRNERGMALAVAIFALVVVGGLVAGAFFIGTQEQRMGENQYRVQQAFGLAEAGAADIIRSWDPDSFNLRLKVFPADTFHLGRRRLDGTTTGGYGGSVYKLNPDLYLLDLTGADTATARGSLSLARRGSGGRQRIGVLTRVRPLQIPTNASLTTQGNVRVAGTSSIDGTDRNPPTWTSCADTVWNPDQAGVRTSATGTVTTTGVGSEVDGNPPVVQDATLSAANFTVFGDVTFEQLALMATHVITAGGQITSKPETVLGVCDKTKPWNWGDGLNKLGPCANHYPIIHIKGHTLTTINNVQGQGILLVDGDLRVQGMYDFFGIVIVRGSLSTLGTATSSAHFWGAVMAQNVDLELLQTIGGAANLNYSKCAIVTALQHTGITSYMRSRGFVTLY